MDLLLYASIASTEVNDIDILESYRNDASVELFQYIFDGIAEHLIESPMHCILFAS